MAIGLRRGTPDSETTTPSEPANQPRRSAGLPTAAPRSRNTAWMIAGAVLVVLSGLTAASIFGSLSRTIDVVVAANSIPEGASITDSDLAVVSIAASAGDIQVLAPSQIDELIGRTAAGPIGNGSVLHPDQFVNTRADAQESEVVIGALLRANNLPVLRLLPGDRVRLFETNASSSIIDSGDQSRVAGRIGDAEVVEAVPVGSNNSLHVALRVRESLSNVVANRIAEGRLTLVLLDSLASADSVAPIDPAQPLDPLELSDE